MFCLRLYHLLVLKENKLANMFALIPAINLIKELKNQFTEDLWQTFYLFDKNMVISGMWPLQMARLILLPYFCNKFSLSNTDKPVTRQTKKITLLDVTFLSMPVNMSLYRGFAD